MGRDGSRGGRHRRRRHGRRAAIPIYTHPDLELARTIVTNPFPGTTMKPSDAEGLAYVPSDNSIWLADDNGHRLFEIDATSGALKRTLTQSTLAAAPQYPSGPAAGTNTASDWEAMTYDPVHDILYTFAGKCCSSGIRAAAFRFLRVNGVFQVDTFQPFSSPLNDFSGVGEINGEIWGALGKVLYKYDFVTNTFSNSFTVPGVSGSIYGISDSPGGAEDVLVHRQLEHAVPVQLGDADDVPEPHLRDDPAWGPRRPCRRRAQ